MRLTLAISKRYSAFNLELDVTLDQPRTGIFGPSGSGKSTLVNLIAGLEQPDSGRIELDGETLFEAGRLDLPPEQRRVGIIFQQPNLFPHLNVTSNLLYGMKRCPVSRRDIDVKALVEVLGIGHLLKRGINNLSGGEKQRVAIGRAVLSNPRLLLMDEPLSALDDTLRFQIIEHLKTVSREFDIPYLFISHSLLEMRLMADEVLAVAGGQQIGRNTPDELARQRLGTTPAGYINLLRLGKPEPAAGLYRYPWGGTGLLLSVASSRPESIVELSSKDIMLFKRHPEAISARNLLPCTVHSLFDAGRKVGVELECGGSRLIAEIVRDAADELAIEPGITIHAAIKASAFRMLGV